MKKVPLNVIGIALTAAGAILSIAQTVVGEKQQQENIAKEVAKALAEKK